MPFATWFTRASESTTGRTSAPGGVSLRAIDHSDSPERTTWNRDGTGAEEPEADAT